MIQIFEVGPRDGLQNEKTILSLEDKLWLVQSLALTGLKNVEAGAFVRADRVPQMADSEALQEKLSVNTNANFWWLVPNQKGLERALSKGVKNIALFSAVSETFNQKNIGMSVENSFTEMTAMMAVAKKEKLKTRGYVSTVWGCPFEGRIKATQALPVLEKMIELGVDQLSIGDTIGVANPNAAQEILKPLLQNYASRSKDLIAVHFHDTRGTALANSLKAFELGVRVFDSSIGGLGGCPFAPGAAGNLASEDLVYLFKEMGIDTGVNYQKLCETGMELSKRMKGKLFTSKALQAYIANCTKNTAWDS
jgi:hydroxymethylglutaryl-CoA lyase